jgi:glucose/arabinose dehydrogenase
VARAIALALAAGGCALVAACGGGGGSGSSAQATDSTPAPSGGPPARAARGVRLKLVGRFASPIYVASPPGDTHRLFVVERAGRIRVMRDGRVLGRPFLDISSDVSTDGERGLLSMAFAPDYARSGLFYVYFTDRSGDIHVRQFRRASANVANASSGADVITIPHHQFNNHDGGQLQFGPDGHLYIGVGDGGSENDPSRNGQKLGTDLAKLLRVDPKPGGGFSVPSGNPFARRGGARPEIWAYGLRNPWRFSFDRRTGALTIGDVGQDREEEIDYQPADQGRGANYGWSVFEGFLHFNSGSASGAVRPVAVTTHGAGNCAIVGGYVVRDRSVPALYGRYVYGDLCNPRLYSIRLSDHHARDRRALRLRVGTLVSFGEDARGHVYAISLSGPVYRLVAR